MGQIKNIKLHIVTDIKTSMREEMSKIYVGGLDHKVTDPDLYDSFDKFGVIESVTIIKDRETGDSRGFGFVKFESESSADKAISAGSSEKGIKVKGELCTVVVEEEVAEDSRLKTGNKNHIPSAHSNNSKQQI